MMIWRRNSPKIRTLSRAVWAVLLAAGCMHPGAGWAATIVADHNAADHYADIPQAYIDLVKTMWVVVPGESHSGGYRIGLNLLAAADSRFQVSIVDGGTPESYTNQHLRFSRASWGDVDSASGWIYSYGEEDWYTSTTAVNRTMAGIGYCAGQGNTLAAIGFGWCWDMTWTNNPGGSIDPVYNVRWAGSSDGGPDGNLRWGLDAGDHSLTGNSVCMDTYINATLAYINYCAANNLSTRVFFTTGPVDGGGNTGENGYQRSLKHEYIRAAANAQTNGLLFDYADILCWSNAGVEQTTTWTDGNSTVHVFQVIHPDNMLDLDGNYNEDGDHIGERGAQRLAQAMWWMLARMAGWNGLPENSTATTTPTASPVFSSTCSPTMTPTPTASLTRTASPTNTGTRTHSPTTTNTPILSATVTATASPTATQSPVVSATSTQTVSATATRTPAAMATHTTTPVLADSTAAISAFPNPAKDEVRFLVPRETAGDVVIIIYNVTGERVAELTGGNLIWDCRRAAAGIYFVRVKCQGTEKARLKVMVNKR